MVEKTLSKGLAIVTGAAGGMGSASSRELVKAGWSELILVDIDAERIESVAAPLRQAGITVDVLAANVADKNFPAQLLELLNNRAITALIHTAGISPGMGTVEQILAVNLDGTARLVKVIAEHMAPSSAVVLFASNSSYFPMPADAAAAFSAPLPAEGAVSLAHLAPSPEIAYPLSKLGVRALVKREAKRFGERGVRLVSVSPGAIDTPMARGELFNSEFALRMIEDSASGRLGQAEEVAAVAVFLCSPAASFMTACDVLVDGGHTAAMGF